MFISFYFVARWLSSPLPYYLPYCPTLEVAIMGESWVASRVYISPIVMVVLILPFGFFIYVIIKPVCNGFFKIGGLVIALVINQHFVIALTVNTAFNLIFACEVYNGMATVEPIRVVAIVIAGSCGFFHSVLTTLAQIHYHLIHNRIY